MRKSSSATAAALREVMFPLGVPQSAELGVMPPYVMKAGKFPDWRANVRPEGLLYRNEPSLMGVTRKLPSGEIV